MPENYKPMGSIAMNIRAGDHVLRSLAGSIPMVLLVETVDDRLIHCAGGWTFLRETGCEIDEELGWDGVTYTGSFLVRAVEVP